MRKAALWMLFMIICSSFYSYHAFGLQQVAGSLEITAFPGDTSEAQWGLISDNPSEKITVEIRAEGPGSEFLSFPAKVELAPNQIKFIKISASIPDDYPSRDTLKPTIFALERGEEGGATVINVQMKKVITLNIQTEQKQQDRAVPMDEPKESSVQNDETVSEPTPKAEEPEIRCGEGTIEKDGQCVPAETQETVQETGTRGGGCLIATATFGSELAPQVQQLRELRDNKLLQTESGTNFMNSFNDFYYSFSPTIADYERENPVFKETVNLTITPLLSSLTILNYVDMDSEAEVLGYGISLILLNIGMYFAAPAIVVWKIRKSKRKTQN